jgi:hypothetical protein
VCFSDAMHTAHGISGGIGPSVREIAELLLFQ